MKNRLLWENEVIKVVDKHTNDNNALDNDISCILEEVDSGWIKCIDGQMPEDYEIYKGRKSINLLVTTEFGNVKKIQRRYCNFKCKWCWSDNSNPKAWMSLPEGYKEKINEKVDK